MPPNNFFDHLSKKYSIEDIKSTGLSIIFWKKIKNL